MLHAVPLPDLPDTLKPLTQRALGSWQATDATACYVAFTGPLHALLDDLGWDPDLLTAPAGSPAAGPARGVSLDRSGHVLMCLPTGEMPPPGLPTRPAGPQAWITPARYDTVEPLRALVREYALPVTAEVAAVLRAVWQAGPHPSSASVTAPSPALGNPPGPSAPSPAASSRPASPSPASPSPTVPAGAAVSTAPAAVTSEVTFTAKGQVLVHAEPTKSLVNELTRLPGLRWVDAQRGWVAPRSRLADIARIADEFSLPLSPEAHQALADITRPFTFNGTLPGLRAVPISALACVDDAKAERFADFGVDTIADLILLVPRRYIDRSETLHIADLIPGTDAAFLARIDRINVDTARRMLRIDVSDGTAKMSVTFFNALWQAKRFRVGDQVLLSGRVDEWVGDTRRALQMANPMMDPWNQDTLPIIPVYPQSAKSRVTTWDIHLAVKEALSRIAHVSDPLPATIRDTHAFPSRDVALRTVHLPTAVPDAAISRERLAFDELMNLQSALLLSKYGVESTPGVAHTLTGTVTDPFLHTLPFPLTGAQQRAWAEIAADLRRPHPMHRLLQGDVGSGKAQPLDAGVLTPHGYVPMGDIHVGDRVINPSGEPSTVMGVFPQGVRHVCRVHFSDGTYVRADTDHLWLVHPAARTPTPGRPGTPTVLTTQHLRQALTHPDGSPAWQIALPDTVDLDSTGLRPDPPYILGTALARSGHPDTHVPAAYLNAPVPVRHALLTGLADTARQDTPTDRYDVLSVTSQRLAHDIAWLARSLSGYARVTGPAPEASPAAWQVHLTVPREFPLTQQPGRPDLPPVPARLITAVTDDGQEPTQCISVSHPNRLYITDHFTVTHNTVVATLTLSAAIETGNQGALMAPTEILASQLHAEIADRFAGLTDPSGNPIQVALITNKLRGKARQATLDRLADGTIHIAVGTHALIVNDVTFAALSTVVVDEQHRFGVEQRAALRDKGPGHTRPDMLVMTATPIPRTAAMTVFGDLDVSILDELPPGRTPIVTTWLDEAPNLDLTLGDPWQTVRDEVARGHQAYVVCPLVEESEKLQAANATETFEALSSGALNGLRLGLVHGQQKPDERAVIMQQFRDGLLDVLVATTVIEVGVNVPNTTIIVVLDCGRFGIAQLHQLRGRVGRGAAASRCILVGRCVSQDSRSRMEALCASTDGFYLSEVDLDLRGHGSVFGTQQSGASDLKVADLNKDKALLEAAHDAAVQALRDDPGFARSTELRAEITAMLGEHAETWLAKS
jgi:ATP-dependent DNA helicase RecG